MKNEQYRSEELVTAYAEMTVSTGIWKSEIESISKYCKHSDPLLDVGCGTGRISIGLYEHGYKSIYALDVSEPMIQKAKQITPPEYAIKYVQSDITSECAFPKGFFRVAIFGYNGLMCIKGIENRKRAIKNIFSMLQPDGFFIFTAMERYVSPESARYVFWKERENDFLASGKSIDDSFGDLYVEDKGHTVFHHFIDEYEIPKMLGDNWCVLDTFLRDDKFKEEDNVLKVSNNCRFFICQKR